MDNFLSGVDFSNLNEEGQAFLDTLKTGAENAFATIRSQSATIADSASQTIAIGNKALKQVIAGRISKEEGIMLLRRGAEQLEDLARAESNLIISNSVRFLKKIGEYAIKFVPKVLGLG